MRHSFYFLLKAHFVLEIITFLFCLSGYIESGLIRNLILISKFMTPQTGQQIITIHILPNISWSKGSQTMKFGQLTEHDMRNCFL